MSSTSILFDAEWSAGGRSERGSFVARMAPEAGSFPVFRTYDLATLVGRGERPQRVVRHSAHSARNT
jgi:hypothetical protein